MGSDSKNDLASIRYLLAKTLRDALKKAYGGKMPSLSSVARDLAVRSPILHQVSNETIRKWLTGTSIPSAIAILALADWLGSEILIPLGSGERDDGKKNNKPNNQRNDSYEHDALIQLDQYAPSLSGYKQTVRNQEIANLLQNLSTEDRVLAVLLIKALSAKQISKDGLAIKNDAL